MVCNTTPGLTLVNVSVVDDSGTPEDASDDVTVGRNPSAGYKIGDDIIVSVFDGAEECVDDVGLDTVGFMVRVPIRANG